MSDIVERLLDYAKDDHERGCQGRCYDCSCGYDDKRDPLLKEAAAEIERLRAALRKIASNNQQRSNCFCGACIQARAARAALEGKGDE